MSLRNKKFKLGPADKQNRHPSSLHQLVRNHISYDNDHDDNNDDNDNKNYNDTNTCSFTKITMKQKKKS